MANLGGRPKVPFDDLEKCTANIGKTITIHMKSGKIITGVIWSVRMDRAKGRDPMLGLGGPTMAMIPRRYKGVLPDVVQYFRSSQIVKFEYLWEQEPLDKT